MTLAEQVHRTHRGLTPRQRQVLTQVVAGKTNKEIAASLAIHRGSVKMHMAAILRRLECQNRKAAAEKYRLLREEEAQSGGKS